MSKQFGPSKKSKSKDQSENDPVDSVPAARTISRVASQLGQAGKLFSSAPILLGAAAVAAAHSAEASVNNPLTSGKAGGTPPLALDDFQAGDFDDLSMYDLAPVLGNDGVDAAASVQGTDGDALLSALLDDLGAFAVQDGSSKDGSGISSDNLVISRVDLADLEFTSASVAGPREQGFLELLSETAAGAAADAAAAGAAAGASLTVAQGAAGLLALAAIAAGGGGGGGGGGGTPTPVTSSGVVVDGYLSGATVARADGSGGAVTTNSDGTFNGLAGSGTIVVTGGVDVSTGQKFTGVLRAPEGSTSVTPLTTVVQTFVDRGSTAAEATTQVLKALGLPSGFDLLNVDPIAATRGGGAEAAGAFAVQKAGVMVATLLQAAGSGGAQGFVTAMEGLTTLISQSTDKFDLADVNTLTTLGVSADKLDALSAGLRGVETATNLAAVGSAQSATLLEFDPDLYEIDSDLIDIDEGDQEEQEIFEEDDEEEEEEDEEEVSEGEEDGPTGVGSGSGGGEDGGGVRLFFARGDLTDDEEDELAGFSVDLAERLGLADTDVTAHTPTLAKSDFLDNPPTGTRDLLFQFETVAAGGIFSEVGDDLNDLFAGDVAVEGSLTAYFTSGEGRTGVVLSREDDFSQTNPDGQFGLVFKDDEHGSSGTPATENDYTAYFGEGKAFQVVYSETGVSFVPWSISLHTMTGNNLVFANSNLVFGLDSDGGYGADVSTFLKTDLNSGEVWFARYNEAGFDIGLFEATPDDAHAFAAFVKPAADYTENDGGAFWGLEFLADLGFGDVTDVSSFLFDSNKLGFDSFNWFLFNDAHEVDARITAVQEDGNPENDTWANFFGNGADSKPFGVVFGDYAEGLDDDISAYLAAGADMFIFDGNVKPDGDLFNAGEGFVAINDDFSMWFKPHVFGV